MQVKQEKNDIFAITMLQSSNLVYNFDTFVLILGGQTGGKKNIFGGEMPHVPLGTATSTKHWCLGIYSSFITHKSYNL